MKKLEYAIVDIETTGGNATHSRITEIAIIIHDGTTILDQWESLVNPEKDIPPAIFALTGIDNALVRHAPTFDFISEKVLAMLTDRVFVAHNVNFDYSFVRHELEKSGFKWTARKLCTVRAARKIKPGLASYSLGNLCRALDIPLENAHRAGSDATATATLFSKLVSWDDEGVLSTMIKKTAQDQRLPPNLPPQDFEQLPEKPGVYYFHNQEKKVVYVGKAINLKKRVASHFTGHSITPQRQNFLRDIHGISYEVAATEFMALLLECIEIQKLWPIYNSALKKLEPKYGLYQYEARNGYRYLALGKLTKGQSPLETFTSLHDGISCLRNLSEQFGIDHRFCNYGQTSDGQVEPQMKSTPFPEPSNHNQKIEEALTYLLNDRPSFAIVDKGRTADERSCVWVEKGHFYGMGYISSEVSINTPSEIKVHMTPYRSTAYIMQLITSYAANYSRNVLKIS